MQCAPTSVAPADAEAGVENESQPPRSGALARHFVSMLLDERSGRSRADARRGSTSAHAYDLLEFGLDLDDEDDAGSSSAADPDVLPLDIASAAVLLAAAFEADPPVLRSLRREASVVVVHLPDGAHDTDWAQVLETCAFGSAAGRNDADDTRRKRSGPADKAVVLTCDVSKMEKSRLEDRAMKALSSGTSVCALSLDPSRAVPERIRMVSDHALPPVPWSPILLSILIEAVTGDVVDVSPAAWIRTVNLDDLRSTVSPERGGTGSLDRLRTVALRRSAATDEVPLLEDLSGYGAAKAIGLAIIEDLGAYAQGRIPWSAVERGMLLVGPPGVGKSLYARSFAKSAGAPLVTASLAIWQSSGGGYLGDCLSAMRKSFAEARASAPSVLFIDELDSVGSRETYDARHRDYSTQVLNGLLEQLDGSADRAGIVVLGATNLLHRIDPAVVRPGRLDRIVHIELPNATELAGILRTCLGSDLCEADLLPVAVAGRGGSGAEAASWVRRARGSARRDRRSMVMQDLLAAVHEDRIPMPTEVRHRVAAHEAGHACAAIALGLGSVHSLTLHSAGGTTTLEADPDVLTRQRAIKELVYMLAGRAAEVVETGSASAGAGGSASSDLALATKLALAVEAAWGLGDNGPIWLGDPAAGGDALPLHSCAPAVRRLLHHAEAEAERLVRTNLPAVQRCAARLIASGYLEAAEVRDAVGDIPPFEVRAMPVRPTSGAATKFGDAA